MTAQSPPPQPTVAYLVLALTSVPGSTAACVTHGNERTVAVLSDYYTLAGHAAGAAGGRVIKVMGDATLITFPRHRAREAVVAMRTLQVEATNLWRGFDERCRMEVKIGAGSVVSGVFGPPGLERPDVYGDALNQLFKHASGEFVMTADVEALLE